MLVLVSCIDSRKDEHGGKALAHFVTLSGPEGPLFHNDTRSSAQDGASPSLRGIKSLLTDGLALGLGCIRWLAGLDVSEQPGQTLSIAG